MLLLGSVYRCWASHFQSTTPSPRRPTGDAPSHRLARERVWTAPGLRPAPRTHRFADNGQSPRVIRPWAHLVIRPWAHRGRLGPAGTGSHCRLGRAGPMRSCRSLARPDLGTAPRLDHPAGVDCSGLSTGHFREDDIDLRTDFHSRMNRFAQQPPRRPPRRHRRRRPDDEAGQARSLVLASLLTLALTLTPPASGAHAAVDEASEAVQGSSAAPHATSEASAAANWVTPVPAMEIITAFDPPDEPWLKGHRGIDVLA